MNKVIQNIFLIVACIFCIYWWWSQHTTEQLIKNDNNPILTVTNISYNQFDENGNKKSALFAKEALYLSKKSSELKQIYLIYKNQKIKADNAFLKNDYLMIKNNIHVKISDNYQQTTNLFTNELNYDLTNHIFLLPKKFIIKNNNGELKANSGRWENGIFYTDNGVKSTYETIN